MEKTIENIIIILLMGVLFLIYMLPTWRAVGTVSRLNPEHIVTIESDLSFGSEYGEMTYCGRFVLESKTSGEKQTKYFVVYFLLRTAIEISVSVATSHCVLWANSNNTSVISRLGSGFRLTESILGMTRRTSH